MSHLTYFCSIIKKNRLLADYYILMISNYTKIAVHKNHLVRQSLYRTLVPSKKRRLCGKQTYIMTSEKLFWDSSEIWLSAILVKWSHFSKWENLIVVNGFNSQREITNMHTSFLITQNGTQVSSEEYRPFKLDAKTGFQRFRKLEKFNTTKNVIVDVRIDFT